MDNPSIMSHVSVGASNFERAVAFYDKVLATIGARRLMEHPGAVAFGKQYPEFWVQRPLDGAAASPGNGIHFGFFASSKEQVQEFYRVALEEGGRDNGPPGPRPHYGEPYYGCFVLDPEGNKIEATYWAQQ